MTWRLAQSLVVLRDQINAMYPDRNKGTDGALSGYTYGPDEVVVNGNNPSSHNINSQGVVCAFDFTTGDYPGGISVAQGMALAEAIRLELKVAPRGLDAYVIHHMEPPYVPYSGPWIADSGNNWEWVAYTGDPHTSHIHISVDYDILPGQAPSGLCPYDMTDAWNLSTVSAQSGTITPIQEDDLMSALDEPIQYQGGRTGTTTLRNEIAWLAANFQTVNDLVKAVPGNTLNAQIAVSGEAKPRNTSLALETSWAASNFRGVAPAVANQAIKLSDGTVASVASVLANIQAKPAAGAAPAVTVDVNSLAAALAPLLATNQVEQFVTEIRNLKFAAQ